MVACQLSTQHPSQCNIRINNNHPMLKALLVWLQPTRQFEHWLWLEQKILATNTNTNSRTRPWSKREREFTINVVKCEWRDDRFEWWYNTAIIIYNIHNLLQLVLYLNVKVEARHCIIVIHSFCSFALIGGQDASTCVKLADAWFTHEDVSADDTNTTDVTDDIIKLLHWLFNWLLFRYCAYILFANKMSCSSCICFDKYALMMRRCSIL